MAQRSRLIPTKQGWMAPNDVAKRNRELQAAIDKGQRCYACGRAFSASRIESPTNKGSCAECAEAFD